MTDEQICETSPYLLDDQPLSVGCLFLARAFAHYCALNWGYPNEEIVAADAGEGPQAITMNIRTAARLIGEVRHLSIVLINAIRHRVSAGRVHSSG